LIISGEQPFWGVGQFVEIQKRIKSENLGHQKTDPETKGFIKEVIKETHRKAYTHFDNSFSNVKYIKHHDCI